MAVTESQRQRLFRKVEEVFGPEEAATFMEVVLPGSWSDVATKRDLDVLRQELDLRLDRLVTNDELHRELRSLLLNIVTAYAAVAGLAVAIAQAM